MRRLFVWVRGTGAGVMWRRAGRYRQTSGTGSGPVRARMAALRRELDETRRIDVRRECVRGVRNRSTGCKVHGFVDEKIQGAGSADVEWI